MRHIQHGYSLIDPSNNYFIVKFSHKRDYNTALFNVPWMIRDHYLHVQKWVSNFVADDVKINLLLVWVWFPVSPVEYFTAKWLERVDNGIRKTLKVDDTTLTASQKKFARVGVEVDRTKPPKAGFRLMGRYWKVQYEGRMISFSSVVDTSTEQPSVLEYWRNNRSRNLKVCLIV